ncbi:MAG: hypothetical protein HQK59_04220 [Deltaproteobacteria bacterium]|nr:hypothetical protein [Deltaproteobacteria bacterium]MBF0527236.1 hypothetical protein [Deltaproteobacteria bacterium]
MKDSYLIPANTVCRCQMMIRSGGAGWGEDYWLAKAKTIEALYMKAEFTVVAGPYTGRKIHQNIILSGGKLDTAGRPIAANVGRSTLRAILESVRGVDPDDNSPEAVTARLISSWGDFNGLEFAAEVGIEEGKDNYQDKNKLQRIVTPDHQAYRSTMAPAQEVH